MEKPNIPYPIIVEGKYDKIKLGSLINADIFVTDGFGVFKNAEKAALFSALAEKTPIIILTDSDGGGTVIRNYFKSVIPSDRLIHLYIPSVIGKEKRKARPSKTGTLGVEGMDSEILLKILEPFSSNSNKITRGGITKTDMYLLGISGRENSSEIRSHLALRLGFPSDITANALLCAVNILYSEDEFLSLAENIIDNFKKTR